MLKLFNLSTHEIDLGKFEFDHNKMKNFFDKYGFDGIEMIQSGEWNENHIPSKFVKGLHMRFWPMWLDFWNGNTAELERQFGNKEALHHFYGGETRDAIVDYYKKEIKLAIKLDVRYVVFHMSHVLPEHCFSYEFTYTDNEVVKAGIELINEVFDGVTGDFDLLFENLWWPGLTLLDPFLANELIERVKYPHKGFMLDISHIMNTNLRLSSEDEAVEYILDKMAELGATSKYIKGIHLNSSLSGEYVRSQFANKSIYEEKDFMKKYCDSYLHVLKIDRHIPFASPSMRKVLDCITPEYLVYEFLTENIGKLEEFAAKQNAVLGLY
jgi:Sugar phosphate isomerases/epimerases